LVNDKDKPDKFEFTDEGEEVSYIVLEEARLLDMQVANEKPGDYGRGTPTFAWSSRRGRMRRPKSISGSSWPGALGENSPLK